MAFVPYSYDEGQPRPFEYYKLSAKGDIEVGTAMALTDGKLAASDAPTYICMRAEKNAAADTVVPVIRIDAGVVFEAPLAAAAAALKAGARASVSADGMSIAGAADGGVLEIVDMDGAAEGDLCRVRFVNG